jgi:hypothetical protein
MLRRINWCVAPEGVRQMNITERFFEMTAEAREQAAFFATRTAEVAPPALASWPSSLAGS